ncbi:MAG TPA: hypothetical protein VL099_08165 [Candidatus Binatia bacterium]|nr:hypothetical protein [Candidatus Binatia bacterium]
MNATRTPAAAPAVIPPKQSPSLARRLWRIFYWGSILVGLWWLFLMLRRAPAPQVAKSPQAARSAAQKLESLAEPPSLTSGGHVRIVLSEEELNSYLATRLGMEPGPENEPSVEQLKSSVTNVEVSLSGDRARAYVLLNLAGKDLTLQLEGKLHVVGGYLQFQPTAGSLGELALPQTALDAAVASIAADPKKHEAFRVPPEIRDIFVENGALVIERR